MFSESEQIIVSRNGVTMLKPHWMCQDYWQHYMIPRCGKIYNRTGVPFGSRMTEEEYKQHAYREAMKDDDECIACKI